MAHDVFISHSSHDKPIADALCATLEQKGIRCWIAPRDITPGAKWGEAIIRAIKSAQVVVLVFSANSNNSAQVEREIQRAFEHGVTVVPLRIEDVMPNESFEYYISSVHWLDALNPPLERHLGTLADKIGPLLDGVRVVPAALLEEVLDEPPAAAAPEPTASQARPAKSRRARFAVAAVALAGVLAIIAAVAAPAIRRSKTPPPAQAAAMFAAANDVTHDHDAPESDPDRKAIMGEYTQMDAAFTALDPGAVFRNAAPDFTYTEVGTNSNVAERKEFLTKFFSQCSEIALIRSGTSVILKGDTAVVTSTLTWTADFTIGGNSRGSSLYGDIWRRVNRRWLLSRMKLLSNTM